MTQCSLSFATFSKAGFKSAVILIAGCYFVIVNKLHKVIETNNKGIHRLILYDFSRLFMA